MVPKRLPTFTVISHYESTGLACEYEADRLQFFWTDWVLCHVALNSRNCLHWALASSFRIKPGPRRIEGSLSLINPCYGEDYTNVSLSSIRYLRLVEVLLGVRARPEPIQPER